MSIDRSGEMAAAYVQELEAGRRRAPGSGTRRAGRGPLEWLASMAAEVVLGVDDRWLLEYQRRAVAHTLLAITGGLTRTLDVAELLKQVTSQAVALVGAEGGFTCLQTPAGLAASGYYRRGGWTALHRTFRQGEGLPAHVLATSRQYLTNDAATDPLVDAGLRELLGFRAVLCTPILDRSGAVVGAFEVHDPDCGRAFDGTDASALTALAQIASIAVQRALAARRASEAERAREEVLDRLVTAHEEERRRIAEDIHDDSLQVLDVALLRLQMLGSLVENQAERDRLAEIERRIGEAESRLRRMLFDLRPPAIEAADGLRWALRELLDRVLGPEVGSTLDVRLAYSLPVPARLIIYRIAQEAIANAVKHAGATCIRVGVEGRQDGVLTHVEDDGRGFTESDGTPRQGHFGLTEMRERARLAAGYLSVNSRPGAGTTVEWWIPTAPEVGA